MTMPVQKQRQYNKTHRSVVKHLTVIAISKPPLNQLKLLKGDNDVLWLSRNKCPCISVLCAGYVKEPMCGGRFSILHYESLKETDNMYAPDA